MIASILTAIGTAIDVLIETLLSGSGGGAAASGGGKPPPKDEAGLKEWIRSKLKALALLLRKLGVKAAEALPGIIGVIISWVLNKATDVVGWVSQNLWALVVGNRGLIYTCDCDSQHNLTFEVIQGSSNCNHTQCNESQLSVMLFIGQGVEITQHRFSRKRWKLMTKYPMIFSHCIV